MREVGDTRVDDVEHALVRLWSGELSEEEAAAIEARSKRDARFREELHGALEVLASMEALADDLESRRILRDARRLVAGRRTRQRLALGMAASVLVVFGAALVWLAPWSAADDGVVQHFATAVGEQQTLALDDGSVVTLNTDGRLTVDYGGAARRVVLERGEAYFEVAGDPRRPFTVDLGEGSVTAVGTAFNIRKSPERYQVAVIEGAVAFSAVAGGAASPPAVSGGARRVEAGWVAEYEVGAGELTAFRPESMGPYRDWRSGMLSFYGAPLHEVVGELNRYSPRPIGIEDASVREFEVYTAVNVREIDAALEGLASVLPIEVTRHFGRIAITASAEE